MKVYYQTRRLPVRTQPMEVNDTDKAAVRSVISGQLEAFEKDNAIGAFSFASQEIQALFGTPANFMRMVRTTYRPVYRPRSVMFEDITTIEGFPTQKVLLLNEDARLVRALYLMQKQPDGTWRIAGCYLVPVEGETI